MPPRLDIARIAAAALQHSRELLPAWLPGGKWDGPEWRCGDLSGAPGKSCACNANSGRWSDFQAGESGGDLVSLYAAIHRVSQGEAAREVAALVGLDAPSAPGPGRPAGVPQPAPNKPRTDWVPLLPVPQSAGEPPRAHVVRGKPAARWDYYDADRRLLGCVYRFVTSDGGKEVLPCTYCEHPDTSAREWRWIAFRDPRPLYWPAHAAAPGSVRDPARPVLVVEGEKCADAAHAELGAWYDVVSWPGGGKAVHKAGWSALAGRRCVLWPDADAKRDRTTQELLPWYQQPGIVTMQRLAGLLGDLGCSVLSVAIPLPGTVADGWDVADAVAEGLTGEALRAWVAEHLEPVPGPAPPAPPQDPPRAPPGGGGEDGGPDWRDLLIPGPRRGFADCRENVMLALLHHPEWRGKVGYNAFADRTESLAPTPWRTGPGEWTTRDDRELGLWLAQRCDLLIRAEANLSAGVEMAAARAEFHPVLAYLGGLRWDGTDRLAHWLQDCCGAEDSPYVRLAGAYYLRSMVARVWRPGSQADHMLVLEGVQGKGKSSAFRTLADPWFSDTQFRLGDKDALLQLVGVWLYEVSELDAFSRAEVQQVKAFLTSLNDRARGVYERRVKSRPRQVVMAGTTNHGRYLQDMTGNRRFWPVAVGDIDLGRLRDQRDQLFAQAFAEVQAGERWWPTRDEQAQQFAAAQDARVIADPWLDELPKRLADIKYADRATYTTAELLAVLGVSADKIDLRTMPRRIEAIMTALDWTEKRERRPDGTRPNVYVRPPDPAP